MADVNFNKVSESDHVRHGAGPLSAGSEGSLSPDMIELIELLFFAYRDFISDPDQILAEFEFGRAHHRVLHFVTRNPGMRVTELLDILKITKQSLGRVLKQLVDEGYIRQQTGPQDRRQRLLYPTDKGLALSRRLSEPQSKRLARAFAGMPKGSQAVARQFLYLMTNEDERATVAKLAGNAKRNEP